LKKNLMRRVPDEIKSSGTGKKGGLGQAKGGVMVVQKKGSNFTKDPSEKNRAMNSTVDLGTPGRFFTKKGNFDLKKRSKNRGERKVRIDKTLENTTSRGSQGGGGLAKRSHAEN